MFNSFDKFSKRKTGLAVFGLTSLLAAYGFASLAIDRGNLLWYALGLYFLFDGLRNIFKLIGKLIKR